MDPSIPDMIHNIHPCQQRLEMLLPELKVHLLARRHLASLPNIPRRRIRTTKVNTDIRPQRTLQPTHVRPIQDAITHSSKQFREIRASEISPRFQLSEWIFIRAYGIQHDVLSCVDVDFLGEVSVDAQELVVAGGTHGLRF